MVAYILANPMLSAHDDVASALARSAQGLSDVESYCPNPQSYAYAALHSGGRIFGLAFGASGLAFRIPAPLREAALAVGARPSEIGGDWMEFEPWGDLRAWCKAAHDHVVGS